MTVWAFVVVVCVTLAQLAAGGSPDGVQDTRRDSIQVRGASTGRALTHDARDDQFGEDAGSRRMGRDAYNRNRDSSNQDFDGEDEDNADSVDDAEAAREELAVNIKGLSQSRYDTAVHMMRQCGAKAYKYCCKQGIPCKCRQSVLAAGQCGREAYGYCCNFGTPCSC